MFRCRYFTSIAVIYLLLISSGAAQERSSPDARKVHLTITLVDNDDESYAQIRVTEGMSYEMVRLVGETLTRVGYGDIRISVAADEQLINVSPSGDSVRAGLDIEDRIARLYLTDSFPYPCMTELSDQLLNQAVDDVLIYSVSRIATKSVSRPTADPFSEGGTPSSDDPFGTAK